MPIYAYRCDACGHTQDVIQKFSDAPLTHCTQCGAAAFRKQLTAPAFQLKGSGWYVTDFRDGASKAKPEAGAGSASAASPAAEAAPAAAAPASSGSTGAAASSGGAGTQTGSGSSTTGSAGA